MEFRSFREGDVPQAARLLAGRHMRERRAFPALKKAFEDSARAEELLRDMIKSGCDVGVCAYDGERMLGFILSTVDSDSVRGRHAFVGYEGLAIAQTEKPELYRALYAVIAEIWLKKGALSHYVVVPAGCREVMDAWLHLSFALQQAYGIARLGGLEAANPDKLTVRQASAKDAQALREISNLIYSFQAASPTYAAALPERIAEIREGYGELPEDESSLLLLALKEDGELVGFQCANTEEDDSSMLMPENSCEISICGTIPKYRNRGVAHLLTASMFERLRGERGYENVIADWRVANLSSSNFWPKEGFTPIAYRMHREIDGRVYWADGMNE